MLDGDRGLDGLFAKCVDECPNGWVIVADELRESSGSRFTQVVRPVLPEDGCVVHVPAARWEHRRNTANDKS